MRIPNDVVQQIQQRADIVEVVGDFVSLKRRGQNMWACCPFHGEKTPSFSVSPARNIFKCFGCGKAGDSITFIMEMEGVSYVEALKRLAAKYGIEIPETPLTDSDVQEQNEKDSLYIVLNYAKDHFQQNLWHTEEGRSVGLSYFIERGFQPFTINAFELGYSMDAWEHFIQEATAKGYNPELLEKAGLIVRKEKETTSGDKADKLFDRFRGRVIFPIHNVSGRVIAFGARTLKSDKNQPKYLNSPETAVYHKSQILYGIYQAKQAIRQEDTCYLVEGYTDVISLHQAGVTNVVASSGTSLTTEQIKLIGRFTQNVTVLYDGDAAGINASLRGVDLILEEGLNVHVVVFPDGDDPDSYVRKIGSQAFTEYIRTHRRDFITFKTELALKEAANDPFKRAAVIKDIVGSITKISDPLKRAVFFKQTAALLQIDEGTLIVESNQILRKQQSDKERQRTDASPKAKPTTTPLPGGVTSAPEPAETATGSQPSTTEPRKSSLAYQEEETIRLLITYADHALDEHNTLSNYLLAEIEDISFQTPIYNQMLEIFRLQLRRGAMVGAEFFVQYPDAEIQRQTIHLLSTKYQISDNWENKYQIFVPRETDILPDVVYTNILRLKQRVVQEKITANMNALAAAQTEAEQENCMRVHVQLKEMEKQIAAVLGNVLR